MLVWRKREVSNVSQAEMKHPYNSKLQIALLSIPSTKENHFTKMWCVKSLCSFHDRSSILFIVTTLQILDVLQQNKQAAFQNWTRSTQTSTPKTTTIIKRKQSDKWTYNTGWLISSIHYWRRDYTFPRS